MERGPASGQRGGPSTGRVPSSVLWASARDLQLTSPKFPAPAPRRPFRRARLGACARVCSAPGAPLSWLPRREPRGRRCGVGEGFKEDAPSPQFAGPRWGCSRFPQSRSTGGPSAAQAARPPLPRRQAPCARAQVSVATCVCTRPEPALGVHVQPRLSVCISGATRRRWSPGLQEGGGPRGASFRSHTPRTAN